MKTAFTFDTTGDITMRLTLRTRLLAPLLATSLMAAAIASAAALPAQAAPVGAGFQLTVADLKFILQQIRISETHATKEGTTLGSIIAPTSLIGPGVNDIPDARLPWGLRQVDGRNNNLTTGSSTWTGKSYSVTNGHSTWGSADQPFPRETTPLWRDTEEPTSPTDQLGAVSSNYNPAYRPSSIQDSEPRMISNIIVDQSPSNPAAVIAAGPNATPQSDGSYLIPNVAPNAGVAAPYNGMFALFGQFFDHGLDLVGKTGSENIVVPLQPDDPLYVAGAPTNFMIANRTILDQNGDGSNSTTPWVDQNQTYTSHPSHQVFLREYTLVNTRPVATGNLLDGAIAGNIANWGEVKQQALTRLGIRLVDTDIFNVPLVLTDEYGRFLRGPNGMPQLVMSDGTVVEGRIATPITTTGAMRTGHAFLDDIAHTAVPNNNKQPDADTTLGNQPGSGFYDDELLGAHFITGDGRGNENIGLTSIHSVFHSEHNRLVADVQRIVTANAASFAATDWRLVGGAWNGERLFQAARLINEMEYQHLVFGEFARKIQPAIRAFAAYDPNLRPDITAEYANAVYRFGHSQLNSTVDRVNADGSRNDAQLLDVFLNPIAFNSDGKGGTLTAAQAAGSVARGMTYQIGNEIDEFVTDTLRNRLLGLPLDLATLNMVRGRDTGMASLNGARRSYSALSGDTSVAPYTSWIDFGLALRHPASLINFIAAYGKHPTITAATTVADKRAAADKLVNDRADSPLDRADFMFGTNTWASINGLNITGLEDIDLWIGGLAEAPSPFGGMLGSTFDFVFRRQMENLQDGDRLYYLARTAGLNLGVQLEANTFAELIMRNTNVEALPADAFAFPTRTFSMASAAPSDITVMPDGTWRYSGTGHVVFNGTAGNDRAWAGGGNDTIRGNDGNDWMQGGMGDDNLVGGLGNDTMLDSSGLDIFSAGDGNDYMASGGPGADLFNAGWGADFMVGGTDATTMLGGPGNDLTQGSDAADAISGDDGSDWLDGGSGSDTISGDGAAPFGIDLSTPGDDVIVGGNGDDLLDGGGAADISVSGPGIDTFLGGFGFDWTTYYNPTSTQAAIADLQLFVPLPADILAGLQDGFDSVEALSGGRGNDTLRGDIRTTLTTPLTTLTDYLNQTDLAKFQGLQLLLGAGVTTWTAGNILIGGAGSDLLEGRSGNDLIDGDASLEVLLSVPAAAGVAGTLDPTTGRILVRDTAALRAAVLAGRLDPGDITILRRILAGAYAGENDVAKFTGNIADYTITYLAGGLVRVVDNIANRDGTDTVRNVETLQFLNGTVTVAISSSPANVTTTSAATSLAVSWAAPLRTGASAITSYTARAYTTAEGNTTAGTACTTAVLTCTITGLTAWQTYFIEVTATNGSGSSVGGVQGRLAATPGTVPGAPLTVAAQTNVDSSATVTWSAPTSNGGSAIKSYTATVYDDIAAGNIIGSCSTTGALTCTVPPLTAGNLYYIDVRASNLAGQGAPNSPRVTIAPVGVPTAPRLVTAAAGNGSATISWALPTRSGGYVITQFTAKAFTTVNGTVPAATCTFTVVNIADPMSCTIPGLTNARTYSVAVSATNPIGTGPDSTPRVSVRPAAAPDAPAAPTVAASYTTAQVTWTAPGNGGSAITGYTARAFTAANGTTPLAQCTTAGTLTCSITGLTVGTQYWFDVTATNVNGSSAASSRAAATTLAYTVPGIPTGLTLTPSYTSVVAQWTAPADTGGRPITAYTVSAFTTLAGTAPAATCATAATLTCTVTGLTAGVQYWLSITATNVVGVSTASARSTTTTTALSAPSAPTIATLTPGNATMRVTWTAPASTGGSTLTGYRAYAYSSAVSTTVVGQCTANGTTLNCTINTGLARRTTYWFAVVATNAIGTGTPSARLSATTT